jgi:hypothetical protein
MCYVVTKCKSLFFCEISSSHGGEYDVQNCLLGRTASYFTRQYIPEDNSENRCFLLLFLNNRKGVLE